MRGVDACVFLPLSFEFFVKNQAQFSAFCKWLVFLVSFFYFSARLMYIKRFQLQN